MKKNKLKNIKLMAVLQGRLVNSEKKNHIQYFPSKSWVREFDIAQKKNIKFIEWVANYENIKSNPIFYKTGVKEIKKYKKKHNIEVRSIDMQFIIKKPFFKSKGKEFNKRVKLLKTIIINTQKIGIKFIILPILENSSLKKPNEEKLFIREIKNLAKYLNHKSYFLIESDYNPKKLLNLIKKMDTSKVKINYDTGNSAHLGYHFNKEKIYFKYVKNIHLKDKTQKGLSVPLGSGKVNFKKFFLMLKKLKYKGHFSLQTARSKTGDHMNEILKNYNFIKRYYNV